MMGRDPACRRYVSKPPMAISRWSLDTRKQAPPSPLSCRGARLDFGAPSPGRPHIITRESTGQSSTAPAPAGETADRQSSQSQSGRAQIQMVHGQYLADSPRSVASATKAKSTGALCQPCRAGATQRVEREDTRSKRSNRAKARQEAKDNWQNPKVASRSRNAMTRA